MEDLLATMPKKGNVKLKKDETAVKLKIIIFRTKTIFIVLGSIRLGTGQECV